MTKEDAIKELKSLEYYNRPFDNSIASCDIAKRKADALNMAIKALSSEPCEDCVSKLSVKEEMIKYGFHAPDMTVTEFVEDILQPVTSTLPTCEDYISREEVIKAIDKHTFDTEYGLCLDDDITCILETVPSVPPKVETPTEFADRCMECGKMRTAEWIPFYTDDGETGYDCSNCDVSVKKQHRYCPNCGKRMKRSD